MYVATISDFAKATSQRFWINNNETRAGWSNIEIGITTIYIFRQSVHNILHFLIRGDKLHFWFKNTVCFRIYLLLPFPFFDMLTMFMWKTLRKPIPKKKKVRHCDGQGNGETEEEV